MTDRHPYQPLLNPQWQVAEAKYLYDILLGKMLQPEPQSPSDRFVPYLRAANVQWTELRTEDIANMYASPREIEACSVLPGDLLVCEGGEVGRAAVCPTGLPPETIIQNAVHRVRVKNGNSIRYLGYLLRHIANSGWFDVLCNKATIAHFTVEKFGDLLLGYPKPESQELIADFLDSETLRLDRLISAKQHLLDLLAEKRRTLIARAITQGINPGVSRGDSGTPWLGEIPAHWMVWRVGHFASVGNGSTPFRDNLEYWTGGTIPWLNSAATNDAEITEARQFVTARALAECHLPLVPVGSVLVAITGQGKTRGQAALLTFSTTINQHIAYVTPDADIVRADFLRLWFVSQYDFLRAMSDDMGGTKGALSCEQITNLRMAVPPLAEQKAIATFVRVESKKMDDLAAATKRTIILLQERRSALISETMTGQLLKKEIYAGA
ncbi:MAG: restriction endonuclease subunit S [Burkholderiaceae bacterium]